MTVKLEVGETYDLRDGRAKNVFAYLPNNPVTGEVMSRPFIAIDAQCGLSLYTSDGVFNCDKSQSPYDLIREHVPPPTLLEAAEAAHAELSHFIPGRRGFTVIRDNLARAIAAEKAKVGQ